MREEKTVTLGGRRFSLITAGTVTHDYYVGERIREAGIDKVTVQEGFVPDLVVEDILDRTMRAGMAITLVACFLLPDGLTIEEWTPATAADVAVFIGRLIEREDKVVFRGLVAEMIAGFFLSGLSSLRISRTSSAEPSGAPLVAHAPASSAAV
jgi:hypothetical protein